MKSAYPKIFEPITIKRTTIKNRIAMTPMGTNYGETSGEMSNRHMNYYFGNTAGIQKRECKKFIPDCGY